MSEYDAKVRARFNAKWKANENGCWLWTGAHGRYGNLSVNKRHMDAHRFSWLLHRGQIPDGMRVLHSCDVSLCVNPEHLFLGTAKDNTRDMLAKGRHRYSTAKAPSGERHWKRRRNVHAFP